MATIINSYDHTYTSSVIITIRVVIIIIAVAALAMYHRHLRYTHGAAARCEAIDQCVWLSRDGIAICEPSRVLVTIAEWYTRQ